MKTYLIIILLSSFANISAQDIEYQLTGHKYGNPALVAYINGVTFTLIPEDQKCINIIKEADFNKNGYKDVLVENIIGCGGNCCGNSYQIFSFDGNAFRATEKIGYDWNGIEIAESAGGFNLIVDSALVGVGNTTMCQNKIETYRLEGYEWELINLIKDIELDAITEIRSADFEGREDQELSLIFDLDNDGINDKITCKYWLRWGLIGQWEIEFGNGKSFSNEVNPKRIGVRHTKTDGVYDLVLDCDVIYQWDGNSYELKEQ